MFPLRKFTLPSLVLAALCSGMLVAVGNLIMHSGAAAGRVSLAAALLVCGLSLTKQRRPEAADLVIVLPLFLFVICLGTVVSGSLPLLTGILTITAATFFLFEKTSSLPVSSSVESSLELNFNSGEVGTSAPSFSVEAGRQLLTAEDFLDEEFEDEETEEGFEESLNLRFLPGEPGETVQQWRRHQTDLTELLEGTLTADFAAGQKQRYLHIPFVPFFGSAPTGYCECSDEAQAEASLDLVHSYGARLSIRRKGNSSQSATVNVIVSFEANRIARRAA